MHEIVALRRDFSTIAYFVLHMKTPSSLTASPASSPFAHYADDDELASVFSQPLRTPPDSTAPPSPLSLGMPETPMVAQPRSPMVELRARAPQIALGGATLAGCLISAAMGGVGGAMLAYTLGWKLWPLAAAGAIVQGSAAYNGDED